MAKDRKASALLQGNASDLNRLPISGNLNTSKGEIAARVSSPASSPSLSSQNAAMEPQERIHGKWQYIALALIALHLLAVFAEPLRFFSRSDVQVAPNAELVRNFVRPYSQFLFLDHGYFFFAPNPGPGHLIRILNSPEPVPTLEDDRRLTPLAEAKTLELSGSKIVQLPDRNVHTPRLLYHRYLMLSEFYYSSFVPPEIHPDLQADERITKLWKRDRDIYVQLKDSLHRYGREKSGYPFARVDRIERELPDAKTTLTDRVRISDIRWQYILPESPFVESPRNSPASTNRPIPGGLANPLPNRRRPAANPGDAQAPIPAEVIPTPR